MFWSNGGSAKHLILHDVGRSMANCEYMMSERHKEATWSRNCTDCGGWI